MYDFMLDGNGYPTEQWIKFVKEFKTETMPIMDFVELLYSNWWMPDWGFRVGRKYKGVIKLYLSTGGWSGNEETIGAILGNFYLRCFMGYSQWNTGGHYIFKIRIPKQESK